ncbi:uncharacterized protein PRCAT00005467001 [Priceomyces carsonii]|uniref:uncharacterized protein n=1 Tax=Priceomyces carsonii TaxID=28549 RepID=UPI002EDAD882|nr:unnamed protein product [Priceomyces carsonii]
MNKMEICDSEFDVNILEDATRNPNVELTFPLPTDIETIVELEGNEKVARSWGMLNNLFSFFSGGNIKFDEIYKDNEYKYSINKQTSTFNKKMVAYMDDQLERSDKMLDDIVVELIERELRMNLIKSLDFEKRVREVKGFMVDYFKKQNAIDMPRYKSRDFVRLCYLTVIKLMLKMFPHGVWVTRSDFSNLFKKYLENPMSIIFLPNHQSHVDYIILHLIAIRFEISIPTVIAGENLNVAVFGNILKGLGAIFIKRSFNNELYTERNLSNIIEFFLTNRVHLEVFIEGTRSRDGKLLLPKYGILKTLTSIYLKQLNEDKSSTFDMLFQPVSITYERTYEADGYLNELVGKNKKQESFIGIIKNGVKNLTKADEFHDHKYFRRIANSEGEYDTSNIALSGKIFVKLGLSFHFSNFINDPKNLIDQDSVADIASTVESYGSTVNLKKLGFKIFHEINNVSYLPPISIVGSSIQAYYYFQNKSVFPVTDLVPIFKLLVSTYREESGFNESNTNFKLLNGLSNLSTPEVVELFKNQIPQFFRYIKINLNTGIITVENSIELLFYKNLTIHLVIHKCLFCFIALGLKEDRLKTVKNVHKLIYVFTGFLKHEFLFDYNYNERSQVTFLFKDLIEKKKIKVNNGKYEVIDKDYFAIFAEAVKPFVESYLICIENLTSLVKEHVPTTADDLVNGSDIYPTTKTLLKKIQQSSKNYYHVEAINKQYLLSCLYYLNNLRLINIFKNKAKTKAYVRVLHPANLAFVYRFLSTLFSEDQKFLDDTTVNYMIDIIDKTFLEGDGIPVKARL